MSRAVQSTSYISTFHYWSFVAIMVVPLRVIVLSLLAIPTLADLNVPFTSYDNDFIEPSYILGKNWNAKTIVAQESIVQWADWLAAQGPWCKFITITLHYNLTLSVLQLSRPPSLFLRPLIIHTIISAGRHSTSDPSSMSIDLFMLTWHAKFLARLFWRGKHNRADTTTEYVTF